jgi:hypothetical protein
MAQYYAAKNVTDLPPGTITQVRAWSFIVVRAIDNVPLCLCESLQAARYVEMLLNDRPYGQARIT